MTLVVKAKQRLGTFALDTDFTSERGITALFGRSGSGKTSMIRIIAGLARPDSGQVILDGDVMTDTDRRIFVAKHRRRFGYVFQEARLFPHLSVRHNLLYGGWFTKAAGPAQNLDRIVALLGIENLLERRPEKLSGGEKQRVAIGRALLSAPRLLLMDEPLAALDDARKAEVMPYLERLRDEMDIPIVYVSHSIAEVARLANQVVVMRDGKVEAVGSAVDVLNHSPASFERRDAGALLEGKVESVDALHRIATITLKSTQLHVPGAALTPGKVVRVRIPSRDVMLAMRRPEALSALNVLEGTVRDMTQADDATIDVLVDCGGDIILSRITSFSAERLGVRIGVFVFAVIKTVALEQ
ncbi:MULTISPECIES: molybdenum ABC transporter ATP-binding protein [unclassified Rhizobium]|uniref:molybdenum ABC transporter ATP-binding protein n=1 Tax=unclassified Rhizobium TaxID=2613769 RepID=UPI001043B53E|nr:MULTISPECIES: molybdenum ABC transporter ATP-binding protein [unclassified Rhizobium]MBB3395915.1 molybdate transport system ATP-binding protein [Rhizobium sp. BK060]MBB4168503.1 molybdate transport system ATP-binding protein [Rhizobium sp. BK538]TCM79932.1 molybdate transport system ATP-binding protein [Rhizobium sp. BK068]